MRDAIDYLKSYTPRTWSVYEVDLADGDEIVLAPDSAIVACNSDSEKAQQLKTSEARFYVDYELLTADRDPSAGAQVGRLTNAWRGHSAQTLAIVSYEAIKAGKLIVLVECQS